MTVAETAKAVKIIAERKAKNANAKKLNPSSIKCSFNSTFLSCCQPRFEGVFYALPTATVLF